MSRFKLRSDFQPQGDQPSAIEALTAGLKAGHRGQTLLGITGSGKTFTVANVIVAYDRPTLIMAPNKTLAAQLYGEMKDLFPDAAVSYFVSYYDYYQPEAYMPASDTFVEKDAIINDQIDRMRHAATHALLSRDDVIIVASVSCIYGIGSAESYHGLLIDIVEGESIGRDVLLRRLVDIQYQRNDVDFHRGTFRVRGDVVEIFPVYEEAEAIRVEFFGDEVEAIRRVDPLRGKVLGRLPRYAVYPGSHYVTPRQQLNAAMGTIRSELTERLEFFDKAGRFVEKQRLSQRTLYDLEMMEQMGFVQGIENYSRHLSGRKEGEPPPTLIDYFPEDFLLVIDESHQTIPQIGAMYKADRSRKNTLVEYGFRLPSARDNRPLQFDEFEKHMRHAIYVSATPGDYEAKNQVGAPIQQLIRPTGLMDPVIELRPVAGQVDSLLDEIRVRAAKDERVLITTLTKRMAEDLTDYYTDLSIRVRYLHSDVDTLERVELLRDLRAGEFDVLVGINLLREGLDLPEVSLVAILDADKEGFLRSERSLIQTIGRAARNSEGRVILFADKVTPAMQTAMDVTDRRRQIQAEYNEEHGIVPQTIRRQILDGLGEVEGDNGRAKVRQAGSAGGREAEVLLEGQTSSEKLADLREQMFVAAEALNFEKAARLRDVIARLSESLPEAERDGAEAPPSKKRKTKRAAGKKKRSRRPTTR